MLSLYTDTYCTLADADSMLADNNQWKKLYQDWIDKKSSDDKSAEGTTSGRKFLAEMWENQNARRSTGSPVIVLASPAAYNSTSKQIDLIGASPSATLDLIGNLPYNIGTVRLWIVPGYSGSPAAEQTIFNASASGSDNNLIKLVHRTDGYLRLTIGDQAASLTNYTSTAVFAPVDGEIYEMEINYSMTTGKIDLFVNGIRSFPQQTYAGTRADSFTVAVMGGTAGQDFSVKRIELYNVVKHTANYVIDEDVTDEPYTYQEQLLYDCTKAIDFGFTWKESKLDENQSLEFPRDFTAYQTTWPRYTEAEQKATLKKALIKQVRYVLDSKLYGLSELSAAGTGGNQGFRPKTIGLSSAVDNLLGYYMTNPVSAYI